MANQNRRTRFSQSSREPKDWRGETPRAGRRSPRGRRSKVAKWFLLCLTLLVLSALCAYLYDLSSRRHRVVPMLVFTVTDYDSPLPPNAWAQEDAERLKAAWGGTAWLGFRDTEINVLGGSELWSSGEGFLKAVAEGLQGVKPGGPEEKENVVLMYVSAHGLVDDEGKPVLLLGKAASPGTDKSPPVAMLPQRVGVAQLLDTVKESRPPNAKIVLFLDAGRIESNWQLGVLYNSFADELKDAVNSAKVPDLVLINSASAGQVAWCFPDLECSAFGLAVCTGLEGRADKDRNGRVTFRELRDYLQVEVRDRVREKYGVSQEPMFLSADPAATSPDADFGLAYVDGSLEPPPTPTEIISADVRKRLDQLWEDHQRLYPWQEPASTTVSTRRDHRLSFEAFQQGLMRLEELRQAGKAYAQDASELQTRLDGLSKRLGEERSERATPAAPSLPLAVRLSTPRQETLLQTIRQHLAGATPDAPAGQPKEVKDAKDLRDLTADEVAWAGWERMIEGNDEIRGELVDRVLDLVQTRADEADVRRKELELVEMRTLRQFRRDGYLPAAIRNQPQRLKDTLRTRRDAEFTASAATEILALDGLRVFASRGDQSRRLAQDFLFAERGEEATKSLNQAGQLYQQAREAESELFQVLAIRDRIWMETPLFLQWSVGGRNKGYLKDCVYLLQQVATLDQTVQGRMSQWRPAPSTLLEGGTDEVRRQITDLSAEAKRLQDRLGELRGSFLNDVQNARERAEDRLSLVQIRNLLRTPLVTGKTRAELGASYAEAYENGSMTGRGGAPSSPGQTGRDSTSSPESAAAAFWLECLDVGHPAELLIDRKATSQSVNQPASPESPDARLSRGRQLALDAVAVRRQLQQLASGMASRGAGQPATGEPQDDWLSRVQAARDASAAVTLLNLGSSADPEARLGDPLGQLERYYRAEFWLWQARRMLDDFYGDDGAASGDQPYFARMAEVCLKEAETYFKLPEIAAARQEQQARNAASLTWESGSWLELNPEKIVLQPQVEVFLPTLLPQVPSNLPPGWAAISLSLEDPPQLAAFALQMPNASPAVFDEVLGYDVSAASSQPLRLVCRIADPVRLPDQSNWLFRVFYRGHVARRPCPVEVQRPGQIVNIERDSNPVSSLQVFWKPTSGTVALCLDCSETMGQGDKMKYAIKSLGDILQELEFYPGFSVSLWLFGHRRYRKDIVVPYEQTWNPNWKKPNDPSVTFENDVEIVWRDDDLRPPRGQDGASQAKNWRDLLDEKVIVPYGYTPLHLAMVRAIEEHLGQTNKLGARRLIVLSDGMHNVGQANDGLQFNPPWKYDPKTDRTADDVARVLVQENRDTRQPIRAFLIADVPTGQLDYLRDTINRQGAGNCRLIETAISDDEVLRRELRRSLGLYRCAVFRDEAPRRRLQDLRLNNETLPLKEPRGSRYAVELGYGGDAAVATAKLAAEGGEAIRLYVEEDGDGKARLVHQRYRRAGETDDVQHSAIAANRKMVPSEFEEDFNPPKFFVAAHPPERLGDAKGWRFPISIQNAQEERFSPRPVEVWAEITPLRRQDDSVEAVGRPYVFYDPVWEVDRPVPVLVLEANSWQPAGANAAGVRLWFKLQRSSGTEEKQISSVRSDREDDFRWRLDEPAVELAVTLRSFQKENRRGWEVVVLEQDLKRDASPQNKLVSPTRVRVELSEPATVVKREFYPEVGRVRHVFRYRDATEAEVSRYLLRITPAEAIKKDAAEFVIPQPLVVPH